jgi:hypothetical protein
VGHHAYPAFPPSTSASAFDKCLSQKIAWAFKSFLDLSEDFANRSELPISVAVTATQLHKLLKNFVFFLDFAKKCGTIVAPLDTRQTV